MPVHAAIEKARQNGASESSGASITCLKETAPAVPITCLKERAPAVPPPVVPAPDDVDEEGERKGRPVEIYLTKA